MPRKGVPFSLAHLETCIIPSLPLFLKPPGTIMSEAVQTARHTLWNLVWLAACILGSRCSALTQIRLSFRNKRIGVCSRS